MCVCACVCARMHAIVHMSGLEEIFRHWFSPSAVWVPAIEPRLSGLVAGSFTSEPYQWPEDTSMAQSW